MAHLDMLGYECKSYFIAKFAEYDSSLTLTVKFVMDDFFATIIPEICAPGGTVVREKISVALASEAES